MKNLRLKRIIAAALIAAMSVSAFPVALAVGEKEETNIYGTVIDFDYNSDNSYVNFLKKYENAKMPSFEQRYKASETMITSSSAFTTVPYADREATVYFPKGVEEWADFVINVPEEGLYDLSFDCNLGENADNEMDISLEINGEVQYNEASNNLIRRVWEDTSEIRSDSRDNQLRPTIAQKPVWQTHTIRDADGYNVGDLKVYLKAGNNTIRLITEGQPFYLDTINVYNKKALPTYAELKKEYEKKGYKPATKTIKVQAEDTFEKTGSTIYPVTDKSSPMTEPASSNKIRLNTIGGSGWGSNSQWISWKFNVEESGLYNISLKVLQNITSGKFSSRSIMLDGQIPCAELETVNFDFSEDWYMKTLGDKETGEEYMFYLEKGEHELKMEVAYGDISNILREVNDAIFDMNTYYRKIVMISGVSPDKYRDYQFEKEIPGIEDGFKDIASRLRTQKEALVGYSGGKAGSAVAQLESMIYDLEYMAKYPEKISTHLTTFTSNISGLSAWVISMKSQPLQMDYFLIKAPEEKEPAVKANMFKNMKFGFDSFIASFTEDYDLISDDTPYGARSVKVWVNQGRDQVGILKDLITDDFTPKTGINIKLELVQGAIIEATLAGRGPDVALVQASDQPVNFAIRNALVDLSKFEDFDAVSKRFRESAMVPFKFQDGYYGLPDTQSYEMMFYRKDILSDLGVGIPNTWSQFKSIVPIIRKNNMDIGWTQVSATVPNSAAAAFTIFNTLMYQKGGKYYADDLKSTDLGSEAAREAFKEATDYYINYEFPQTYNFDTRFRTGDMPISIQGYTLANNLSVSAPEIKGLWDMAPLPGTEKEDGTIDRSQTSVVTACTMFKNTPDKEAAWEFMKWYTSADIQARYGLELEKVMGPAARYATANVEAFEQIPWSNNEKRMLKEQWSEVKGVPEVPGSYYTPRSIQNAFRTAIYDYASTNAYETLHEWQLEIDKEIERKYEEFGLN